MATAVGWEQRVTSEGDNLERLLGEVGRGRRALIGEGTRALVSRFGDRGVVPLLVDGCPRVVFSDGSA